jgi:hypothetical protein
VKVRLNSPIDCNPKLERVEERLFHEELLNGIEDFVPVTKL